MKKFYAAAFCAALTILCAAQERDPALIFAADFDNYSAKADFAAGKPENGGISQDLSLRMFPGVAGKGNSVNLKATERISYSAYKNFDPRQGTVSFWMAPQAWNYSKKGLTTFFETRFGEYYFGIYEEHQYNTFSFVICTFKPKYREIGHVRFTMPKKDWAMKRWHKIDAVWNDKMMALYLDGGLVKPLHYTKNPYLFTHPVKFPATAPNRAMQIGWGTRLKVQDTTAFDDLKIYDRVLSASEIKLDYEKKIPRKNDGKRPELMVPDGKNITPDGNINAAEWSDAASVIIRNPEPRSQVKELYAKVLIKKNAKDLMLAAEVIGGSKADITGNDIVDIWRDDAFEFHVMSADKKRYQLIINPAGALFDVIGKRNDGVYDPVALDTKWQSGAKYAVKKGKGKWFLEMIIPRKKIGANNDILANFCATRYGETSEYVNWATDCEKFYDEKRFGKLNFSSKARTVRMEQCAYKDGEFHLELTPRASAKITTADGKVMPRPAGKSWKVGLEEGIYEFSAQAKDFFYFTRINAGKPFELDYTGRPALKRLDVLVDLSGAGNAIRKKIAAKKLKCTASLLDGNKKLLISRTFPVKSLKSVFELPLPELVRGTWQLKADISDNGKNVLSAQKRLRIPDMTPFKAKVEANHTVPPPWFPVKVLGNGRYEVWNRVYTFKNGPFPVQVISEGKKMLAKAPDLYLAGKAVRWSSAKVTGKFDDESHFAGTGFAPGLKFNWTSVLSFDGSVRVKIKMAPAAKSAEISDLKLSWQIPAEFGRAMLSPLLTKWDNKGKYVFPYANDYDFCIWTMGIKHGFIWHPVSRANWRNANGHKQFSLERSGNLVKVNADFITIKSKLEKTALYDMVFMATPGRPEPARRRDLNIGHIWGKIKNESWRVQYFAPTAKPVPYSTEPWTSLTAWNPQKYQAHIEKLEKQGTRYMPYCQPMMLESIDDYYDLYFKEWRQIPGYTCGGGVSYKTGEHYYPESCCGETAGEDLAVWRAAKHLKDFPGVAGLYYDCAVARSCSNTLHGCAGIDAFGREYTSSAAARHRNFYIRLKRVFAKHPDKVLYLHAHERFLPFLHGLADYYSCGEEYFTVMAVNPRYFYSETVPLKSWQTLYYSGAKGTGYLFETAYYWITRRKMTKEDCTKPEYTWGIMTVCMLHDFNLGNTWLNNAAIEPWWVIKKDINLSDAEFHGYWFSDAVKASGNKVYASYYTWKKPAPYKALMIVGNLSRKDQKTDLAVDWKKLGINPAKVQLTDLWTGKKLDSVRGIKVKSNNFRLIGIK
ncbi:MAG: hypothetical protein IKC05_08585 [Lentisphaeria bacterium]|nr:hypothetical protein [Lentisphaeria bacterium]